MRKITVLFLFCLFATSFSAFSNETRQGTDAPVSIFPNILATPNSNIQVPVKVVNFIDIGAVSLTIHFDGDVLNLTGFTNNAGFPGLFVFQPVPGIVNIAGFNTLTNFSLPDSAVFFTLNFFYSGGCTALAWFDNGGSCEYTGPFPDYTVLNDIPQEDFYINGVVSEPGLIVLTCPNDINANTESGECFATVNLSAQACGIPEPAITFKIGEELLEPPYNFAPGIYQVTAIASNDYATETCEFVVSVIDNEIPWLIDPQTDCSSLNQANILISREDAESFDASTLEPKVSELYTDNCEAQVIATFLNAFTVEDSNDIIWEIEYLFQIQDDAGNTNYCTVIYSGGLVPPELILAGEMVEDMRCYSALNYIIAEDVTVTPQGFLTLIAGVGVSLLPGFTVQPEGMLHAFISEDYCINPESIMRSVAQIPVVPPGREYMPDSENLIIVYPNPVFNLVIVELKGMLVSGLVDVYSASGKKVISEQIHTIKQIDMSHLPEGLYFLRVYADGSCQTEKIIKLK